MTTLTSLTFNSEAGMLPGAVLNLTSLSNLRVLSLGDTQGNNSEDIDAMCRLVTQLTELHMGYCPFLQPPVLRKLHEAAAAAERKRRAPAGNEEGWISSMISSINIVGAVGAMLPAIAGSSSSGGSGSSGGEAAGEGQLRSDGPQPLTVLSVNIDAEEGEEILMEMSRVSTLKSLLVDSTDEFR
jgi:hypothetical protein